MKFSIFFGLFLIASNALAANCGGREGFSSEVGLDLRGGLTEMHISIKSSQPFPSYYGKNLDALYDVLTDMPRPLMINLSNDLNEASQLTEAEKQELKVLFQDLQSEQDIQICTDK